MSESVAADILRSFSDQRLGKLLMIPKWAHAISRRLSRGYTVNEKTQKSQDEKEVQYVEDANKDVNLKSQQDWRAFGDEGHVGVDVL